MDFDAAWCPACDRQILPKRYTLTIPPVSPKKQRIPAGKRIPKPKQRVVIDQGPIPLYCSDECQFADLHTRRRDDAPLDPARDEKPYPPPTVAAHPPAAGPSSPPPSPSSSEPLSSIDRLAALYNFPPLPPPMPVYEEPAPVPRQEYTSGIIMAGRLINSLCPPPAKPFTGRYKPVQEPRKPTPGWNDGSNAWRSAVYSCVQTSRGPFHRREGSVPPSNLPPARFSLSPKSASSCALSSAPAAYHHPSSPSPHAAEEMISKFSETFIRRSESRVSLFSHNSTQSNTAQNTATPSSPVSTHSLPIPSPRRERHLVHPRAQGKLLVPNVTLKVHSGSSDSSASLSSAWSGPSTTPSSRRSARSPLSATSDSDEETKRSESILSRPRRPVENTRSWSYDNVKTYDMMPLPPKKVKRKEKRVVDGEEKEVEVEVEVYEEPKRLFLFAPTTISR